MALAIHEERDAPVARKGSCSPIVDLRQYTLYPGTRDSFVDLFDRELVETQEAVGMRVIGQFRDLSDPNRFVWMRGFPDMPSREKALTSFYAHSDAWRTHADTARSHMIDSTDALLLRPAYPNSGFDLEPPERRPPLDAVVPHGVVVGTIYQLQAPTEQNFPGFFEDAVAPVLMAAGASMLGMFATEHSPNNFPRLPIREGETVFITFSGFKDLATYHDYMTALGRNTRWRSEIYPSLFKQLRGRPQILRLRPTSRSQLRA
jgi:hypothetical protein